MADLRNVSAIDAQEPREKLEQALFQMRKVIVGQEEMLQRVVIALLTGGHILIEGVPGLAKTLTIKTLAEVLGGVFHRIQFTPDLVPSDIVGTRIYRQATGEFDIELGPVFCNFLLADEINRAPAKVQSALLEVMQEKQVTIGKETFILNEPFLVMATENPIESEGTYPLPEAQVDRFMMKILVDYPEFGEETMVVERSLGEGADVEQVITAEELVDYQERVEGVYVDRLVMEYAVGLTAATRTPAGFGMEKFSNHIAYGASPRGSINLIHGARAMALMRGRSYALPGDVKDLAKDVLRHRISLTYEAVADGVTADTIVDHVVSAVPAPNLQLGVEEPA